MDRLEQQALVGLFEIDNRAAGTSVEDGFAVGQVQLTLYLLFGPVAFEAVLLKDRENLFLESCNLLGCEGRLFCSSSLLVLGSGLNQMEGRRHRCRKREQGNRSCEV